MGITGTKHKYDHITSFHNGHALTAEAYEAYKYGLDHWMERMKTSLPFEVGKKYYRNDGVVVECIELSDECALFSDWYPPTEEMLNHEVEWLRLKPTDRLGWRYNRPADRGRCTGSRYDLFKTVIPHFPEPNGE